MNGPLEGIKILDFTTLLPGPLATMHLADLGADVLRVSTGTRVDMLDFTPPLLPGKNFSAAGAQLARSKRSILLNLREPEAVQIVKDLVAEYDIVIEQFRPGVMDRLGIGYEALSAINPRVIYCAITGYGKDNSLADKAGHDIDYLSLAGVMGYSGRRGEVPSLMGVQGADISGGTQNAVISVLAAVIARGKTGRGQYLDVSMTDGAMALNAIWGPGAMLTGSSPGPEDTMLNGGMLYDFYETKDGKILAYGGLEPKFWESFCRTLGREEWIEKTVDAGPEIKAEVREIFRTKDRDEWLAIFAEADCCLEPVLELHEALLSDYAKERGMAIEVPDAEGGVIPQIGSPFKFSDTPVVYKFAGRPGSAEETKENLLAEGYCAEQIDEWIRKGVLK